MQGSVLVPIVLKILFATLASILMSIPCSLDCCIAYMCAGYSCLVYA